MRYLSAFYTDIGTQKKSNQDSLLIQEANTATGTTLLAVLCDGLGGLQKGEIGQRRNDQSIFRLVSISVPGSLNQRFTADVLRESWSQLVSETHRKLTAYGKTRGLSLGTTVEAVLFAKNDIMYFILEIAGFTKKQEFCSRLQRIRPIFSRRWIMEE